MSHPVGGGSYPVRYSSLAIVRKDSGVDTFYSLGLYTNFEYLFSPSRRTPIGACPKLVYARHQWPLGPRRLDSTLGNLSSNTNRIAPTSTH